MTITLNSYTPTNTELFHQPITHDGLKKFGMDMTQKATRIMAGQSSDNIKKVLPNQSLGLLSIYKMEDTIQIIDNNYGRDFTVIVDKNTGFILHSNDSFNHISKFDIKTFPNKQSAELKEVNYWNRSNNYINNNGN